MNQLPESHHIGRYLTAATTEFFATMVGLPVEAREPVVMAHHSQRRDGVFATVGIAGWLSGTGTISLSETLACRIASAFLGEEFTEVNLPVLDATGEMANMIIGQLKAMLESHGDALLLSIPTVIYGKNFLTRALSQQDALAVEFRIEQEALTVALAMTRSPGPHAEPRTPFVHLHYVAG